VIRLETLNGQLTIFTPGLSELQLYNKNTLNYCYHNWNNSFDYIYSGSNTIDGVAWHIGNAGSTTHEVGKKTANELGIYDLSGNVREWCWDLYGAYPGAQTDYRGAVSGTSRVTRGGSWGLSIPSQKVDDRSFVTPDWPSFDVGFRVVRN
jgi:formylglycine-generating enzyme required for sulfatase activity